jgi:hypothetical protein
MGNTSTLPLTSLRPNCRCVLRLPTGWVPGWATTSHEARARDGAFHSEGQLTRTAVFVE